MRPFLVRNVIFPLHERLLRRPTRRCLRELADSQWWSPDDLRDLQTLKLGALLRHAQTFVPFYRRRFEEVGVDLERHFPQDLLSRLPLLDKAQIRENLAQLVWSAAPGGIFQHNTGGSTGEPLQFLVDRRRQAYDQAARIRTHQWFDVRFGEKELFLWGSPIEIRGTDRMKRLRDGLFNQRLLNAFEMSTAGMDEFLDDYDRFQPRCVFGYPSSLALWADHARNKGRRLDTRRLRAVFVTGEVCHPKQRESITEFFGVPVADGYGSREAGFIAHECPKGKMHLTAENVLVEIVRDGKPAAVGESGEIVVTHLDAYAMPFIRYRTGDVGRLLPGRCSCGRGLPLMDVIQGRATDFLYLPDGTIKHALSIIYPLRETPEVRQFRVSQAADYSVTVHVVPSNGSPAEHLADKVLQVIRPVIGNAVGARVEMVEAIPVSASGKHRYVESHAPRDGNSTTRTGEIGISPKNGAPAEKIGLKLPIFMRNGVADGNMGTGARILSRTHTGGNPFPHIPRDGNPTVLAGEMGISPKNRMGVPPKNNVGEIEISHVRPQQRADWDDYVLAHDEGTLFHTMAWHDAVLGTFRHGPHYLMATTKEDRITGVLPLFLVNSRLGGRMLVSVPYGVGGGILADNDETAAALWSAARRLGEERRCRLIDLRSERAVLPDLPVNDRYVGFRRELPAVKEAVLGLLPRKARAVVRHARDRLGLTVSVGDEYLSEVWRLYCVNMRRLGSINYPLRFFEQLITATPDRHWIAVVRRGDEILAGLVTFLFKDRVMPYFFGCRAEARCCGAANFLYFSMMELGVESGYRVFDFGRSRRDNTGSIDFKRFQGFEPYPLGYQHYVPPACRTPNLTPSHSGIRFVRAFWRLVPLCVTKPLGACLARHVPG